MPSVNYERIALLILVCQAARMGRAALAAELYARAEKM